MANEAEWSYATQVTLEASGASAANAAYVQADDTTLASANHSNYPLADFVLAASFGADLSSAGSLAVNLYRRSLNIDSTNDASSPSASNERVYVGSFTFPNSMTSTATAYVNLEGVPLVADQDFWLENDTGASMDAGWTLKVTPKTMVPGA